MYVCMYACMYVYVCMYVRMYVCIYVCMYVRTYVCMYMYADEINLILLNKNKITPDCVGCGWVYANKLIMIGAVTLSIYCLFRTKQFLPHT